MHDFECFVYLWRVIFEFYIYSDWKFLKKGSDIQQILKEFLLVWVFQVFVLERSLYILGKINLKLELEVAATKK